MVGTDGRQREPLLKLGKAAADGHFGLIDAFFDLLKAPANRLGNITGRAEDDLLKPFKLPSIVCHVVELRLLIKTGDYSALPTMPRRRLSPWRITLPPFWPAVMPFL